MATATAPPVGVERLRRSRSITPLSWDRVMPILMIAPSVILIAVFVYGFIGRTAYTSLTAWRGVVPDYTFVGLRNYERLFQPWVRSVEVNGLGDPYIPMRKVWLAR